MILRNTSNKRTHSLIRGAVPHSPRRVKKKEPFSIFSLNHTAPHTDTLSLSPILSLDRFDRFYLYFFQPPLSTLGCPSPKHNLSLSCIVVAFNVPVILDLCIAL